MKTLSELRLPETAYYKSEELEEIYDAFLHACQSIRSKVDSNDEANISRAFELALEAHGPQRRKSGEPYIFHPIEVARICAAELSLGPTAIIAALLHDVVEDTSVSLEDIRRDFGEKIAMIVDGLTKFDALTTNKVGKVEGLDKESPQAENFKKVLLTISKDVRVVLIKMADRLHNMRTLDAMSASKQVQIASETSYIYAPLAHRLGFYTIKSELEDLCFRTLEREKYEHVVEKLEETSKDRDEYIETFIRPIQEGMELMDFDFEIFGRVKSISSIHNKLDKKQIPFEEIYDIFAIRIILDVPKEREKSACWHIYSLITDHYTPVPERLKDWISMPKSNGYESLHTTVMGPRGRFVEVQIRSKRMDEIAELGFAAHWKYKGINSQDSIFEDWLSKARELLENPSNDVIDFLNDFKMSLFAEEVYVFTPKGDMRIFPKGATALDFAFDIHSDIGLQCKAVKVDRSIVPLSYKLKNGDQLHVVTSKAQRPSEDWLRIVKTGKARTKIRQSIKEEKLKKAALGREALDRKLKALRYPATEENFDMLSNYYGFKNRTDFYDAIYQENLDLSLLKNLKLDSSTGRLFAEKSIETPQQESQHAALQKKKQEQEEEQLNREFRESRGINPIVQQQHRFRGVPKLLIDGEDASHYAISFSNCCTPVPGDEIFGYVLKKGGITIHRKTCPNAENILATYGYRVRRAEWLDMDSSEFEAELLITGMDNMGVVQRISDIITNKLKVNMKSFSMSGKEGHFEGKVLLLVQNKEQLQKIIKEMKALEEVQTVARIQ